MAIETSSRIFRAIHLSAVYTVLDPNEFQKIEFNSTSLISNETYPARHVLLGGDLSIDFGSGGTAVFNHNRPIFPEDGVIHSTDGYMILRALDNGAKFCCLFPFTGYTVKHTQQTVSNGGVVIFPKMNFVTIIGSDFSVNGKRITDGFFMAAVVLQDAEIVAHSDIQIIKYHTVKEV